jgi:4-alpha-glucanotransferase
VALESRRNACAVIGEDLGTVPEGFREAMQAANVLSYRVLMFERHADSSFKPPCEYPIFAAASTSTHDLATLKGFWLGRDIEWRQQLRLYPDNGAEAADTAERSHDRLLLLQALAREGLLAAERFGEFLPAADRPVYSDGLAEAICAYIARSRASLALVQVEDVIGECEQANLPGTVDGHPNWRRRLPVPLEDLLQGPALIRVGALFETARRNPDSANDPP